MKKFKDEKKVQKEILDYLKSIKCYVLKTMVSNRRGIPDIICGYKGKFIAIEVKAENKDFRDVSELQKIELGKINDTGNFGFYANNVDYVKSIFNSYIIKV